MFSLEYIVFMTTFLPSKGDVFDRNFEITGKLF